MGHPSPPRTPPPVLCARWTPPRGRAAQTPSSPAHPRTHHPPNSPSFSARSQSGAEAPSSSESSSEGAARAPPPGPMAPAPDRAGKGQLPHFPPAPLSSSPLLLPPPTPSRRGGTGASPRCRGRGRPFPDILPPRRCFSGGGERRREAVRGCPWPRAPPLAGLQRCRLPPPQPGAGGGERKREKGKSHCSHWAAARGISSSCRGPRGWLGPAAPSFALPGSCFSHPASLRGRGLPRPAHPRASLASARSWQAVQMHVHMHLCMHARLHTCAFVRKQNDFAVCSHSEKLRGGVRREAAADTSGAGGHAAGRGKA